MDAVGGRADCQRCGAAPANNPRRQIIRMWRGACPGRADKCRRSRHLKQHSRKCRCDDAFLQKRTPPQRGPEPRRVYRRLQLLSRMKHHEKDHELRRSGGVVHRSALRAYHAVPICDALPTTLSRIMDIRRSGPAPHVYHPARATAGSFRSRA